MKKKMTKKKRKKKIKPPALKNRFNWKRNACIRPPQKDPPSATTVRIRRRLLIPH